MFKHFVWDLLHLSVYVHFEFVNIWFICRRLKQQKITDEKRREDENIISNLGNINYGYMCVYLISIDILWYI